MPNIPTLVDIQAAHQRIRPFIHQTPVLTNQSINRLSGARIFFKCENLQKVGAFKMRGASNAVLLLNEREKKRGVATHSSGNHAQAVALAAKLNGLDAHIVMPQNSPKVKVAAVRDYGANITFSGNTIQSREQTLERIIAKTGAAFIHPYNNYHVITGQATAALELLQQAPKLDVVLAPVGGGGLISGTALTVHYLQPEMRTIGAEPKEADDAYRSFVSGQIQTNSTINTIADGLRTSLGPKTFGIIQQYLHDIITVSEVEIVTAMRLIWERMKIIIEPSCAVPLAAVLQQKQCFNGKKVGIILSGGNVDLANLPFDRFNFDV